MNDEDKKKTVTCNYKESQMYFLYLISLLWYYGVFFFSFTKPYQDRSNTYGYFSFLVKFNFVSFSF